MLPAALAVAARGGLRGQAASVRAAGGGRHAVARELTGAPRRRARGAGGAVPPDLERTAHRSQAAIGALGLVLVIAFSLYLFVNGRVHRARDPGGARAAALRGAAGRLRPGRDRECSPALRSGAAGPPRAQRVRPSSDRAGAVRAGAGGVRAVGRRAGGDCEGVPGVEFAAVAVDASRAQTAALVRAHRWRIPVAYDSDGAVAALYGVSVCPLIELADRGGTVAGLLIGKGWNDPRRLARAVARLLARS